MIMRECNWKYFADGKVILGVKREEIGEFIFEAEKALKEYDFCEYSFDTDWTVLGKDLWFARDRHFYIWLVKSESTNGSRKWTIVNASTKLPEYNKFDEFYEMWGNFKNTGRDLKYRPFTTFGMERYGERLYEDGTINTIEVNERNVSWGVVFKEKDACKELNFFNRINSVLLYFKETFELDDKYKLCHSKVRYHVYCYRDGDNFKYSYRCTFHDYDDTNLLVVFPIVFNTWCAVDEACMYLNEDGYFQGWI